MKAIRLIIEFRNESSMLDFVKERLGDDVAVRHVDQLDDRQTTDFIAKREDEVVGHPGAIS